MFVNYVMDSTPITPASAATASTTGTFAGAGANNPQPLNNAPPFGPSSPAPVTTRTRIHPRPPVRTGVINVSSSDELLALLDDVHPGRGGRIRMLGFEERESWEKCESDQYRCLSERPSSRYG